MYVYEPGSGFTGEAKLIEPGFEWSDLTCSSETAIFDSQIFDSASNAKINQKVQPSELEEITGSNRYSSQ